MHRTNPQMAVDIFHDFWESVSATERAQIMNIAADEHYCSIGIVHFSVFLPR